MRDWLYIDHLLILYVTKISNNIKLFSIIEMNCEGQCIELKKSRKYDSTDSRFCRTCDIFIKWDGYSCPCCQTKLKSKPRNSKRLKAYLENNPEKEPKRI